MDMFLQIFVLKESTAHSVKTNKLSHSVPSTVIVHSYHNESSLSLLHSLNYALNQICIIRFIVMLERQRVVIQQVETIAVVPDG